MLDRIRLGNFKAARDLDLPLGPLTLLAGLNGSGKSTILQALAAVRQSYTQGHVNGMRLGGPLTALGQGIDVLSEGAKEDTITVETIDEGGEQRWTCRLPSKESDASEIEFIESPSPAGGFAVVEYFQYLQADRIVPRTLYPQADQQARNLGMLGSHGEFTADFLARNGSQVVSLLRRCAADAVVLDEATWAKIAPTHQLLDQVNGWLQQISPGVRCRADVIKRTDEVVLKYQYVGQANGLESSDYRPTHVGFGLTYSLPILVACLAAPPGALLLIENPEAHLHPQGQAKIGELLARCAADDVQILVETHSDHVLNGIRVAVKRGLIKAEQVRLCYFTRDVSTGDCHVELPSVLPDGQLSNWPEGFFDQWEVSLEALLD